MSEINESNLSEYLMKFIHWENINLDTFSDPKPMTKLESQKVNGKDITWYINEFWTAKQRKASSLHEISYRACFKGELPRFFIKLFSKEDDVIYDPFSGRGTTGIEAGLLGRNVVLNDINPLSEILSYPRFFVPELKKLKLRLEQISIEKDAKADLDLSMFYHPDTEAELVSLKKYLAERDKSGESDELDRWIRMVATNRLTGHSRGFFSVYTLPPNQAVSAESQRKINEKRNQEPDYRDTKKLILNKTKSLISDVTSDDKNQLSRIGKEAVFLTEDARSTKVIQDNSIQLTVTSPPFLNIVQYSADNWLRCWFNSIDAEEIDEKITMARTVEEWSEVMLDVFNELYRVTKEDGWVAFEVGELRKGKLRLEDVVIPLGLKAGFNCEGVVVNQQEFTKTSNIWGVNNMEGGTNTNRIMMLHKK